MGLWADGQTLWWPRRYQLWRFENMLRPGELYQECDRLYVPKIGHTTGDLDVHDVAVDGSGRLVFVNTLFGCLATLSEQASFTPLWRPPFLSKLAAEDRCHLNGLALAGRQAALRHGRSAPATWPTAGATDAATAAWSWKCRPTRSSPRVCPCRTRRASTAAGSGCSNSGTGLPGQRRPGRRGVRAADLLSRATCADWPSRAITRWSACPVRGTTRRSAAWPWRTSWSNAGRRRAADCR